MTSAFFYNTCTAAYVIALFGYIFNSVLKKDRIRQFATITTALGFLAQTVGMVIRWAEAGLVEVAAVETATGEALSGVHWFIVFTQHPPWSNLYEIMVYMSWGLVLVFLVTEVKWRARFLGVFAMLLALTALGLASLTDGEIKPLVPALKSWWIMIHVISASIAYAAGSIAAVASLLYLVKAKEKITLTMVGALVMMVSAFVNLLLGRGLSLFTEGVYRVRLLKELDGNVISVGRMVGDQFAPHYVVSPGVGPLLILAIATSLFAAVVMFRNRKAEPTTSVKIAYGFACIAQMAVLGLMLLNNVVLMPIHVEASIASQLMPPAPWTLGLKSNPWDLALFLIILGGQFFVLLALLKPAKLRDLLPEPAKLDRVAYANIMVSFALVAVVLVTGALWAHYAWGRYWGWDPKETGALVIWLNYALYLHTRLTHGWSGTRSAMIGILGFFIILAGFLGVNLGFFATGLHSYGSS